MPQLDLYIWSLNVFTFLAFFLVSILLFYKFLFFFFKLFFYKNFRMSKVLFLINYFSQNKLSFLYFLISIFLTRLVRFSNRIFKFRRIFEAYRKNNKLYLQVKPLLINYLIGFVFFDILYVFFYRKKIFDLILENKI